MPHRPKFAVVREDPELEARVLERAGAASCVLVASGGCTALTLARENPQLRVSAFDANPAQLSHCRAKESESNPARLGLETDGAEGLNQRGAFEGLFRTLRGIVLEFVTTEAELERFFTDPSCPADLAEAWFAPSFWTVAFDLAFSDSILRAMFGDAALQHAEPGSYPRYFRAAFERGLRAPGAARNPFLQHVWLGRYLAGDAPRYIQRVGEGAAQNKVEWIEGSLLDAPTDAGLYSLSNVFDWSSDDLVREWAEHLKRNARPGTSVLLRQLNNARNLRRFFEPEFTFDDSLGKLLLASDRSLFYSNIEVGFRAG